MASLNEMPDELIRHTLFYLKPEENIALVQCSCRHLYNVSNDLLLWRYYCCQIVHWDPRHSIRRKLQAPAASVDWKRLWLLRKRQNVEAADLLDRVLQTRVDQHKHLRRICLMGLDVKDFLVGQMHMNTAADDSLARKYWASTVLSSIHRGMAVQTWSELRDLPASEQRLDRAFGAFDMFVLHDAPNDMDWISARLSSLALEFKREHARWDELSTRRQALDLVRWLRARDLVGMADDEENFRNLKNALIGHALSEDGHPSLPIVSCAIFTSIGQNLGLNASCVSIPMHVHAMVTSPPGLTLDGERVEAKDAQPQVMILDPYGSESEISPSSLSDRLAAMGWSVHADQLLEPAPVAGLVIKMAHNIKATYSLARARFADDGYEEHELQRLRRGRAKLNLEASGYGAMWADLLMSRVQNLNWDAGLDHFLNRFALSFPEDSWMVEKYLLPLVNEDWSQTRNARFSWESARGVVSMLAKLDARQPRVSRRYTEEIRGRVRYKIGQVVRHKRYGFVGIINGWSASGWEELPTPHHSSEHEVEDVPADRLRRGRAHRHASSTRTFYTCLRTGVDRARVAQDSLDIVTDPTQIPESLMYLAGKFFKRFDPETCTFVSNIREFYPDD